MNGVLIGTLWNFFFVAVSYFLLFSWVGVILFACFACFACGFVVAIVDHLCGRGVVGGYLSVLTTGDRERNNNKVMKVVFLFP
ncbi:hypothetical protein FN846DRAFT_954285 [Sphaerosporella brunnea]|uniref:Transmembrane protein n=1 Tax=Sphaerosporella brunnea TaxID=1250544 RepID=A0A5J5ET79_9PEZI|nr:hypothetical protein FN846DRAFT_954285 [Sphaerosporella brunnea]